MYKLDCKSSFILFYNSMLRRPSYKQFLNQTKEVQSSVNLSFNELPPSYPPPPEHMRNQPTFKHLNKQRPWENPNINVVKYLPDDPRALRHTYAQDHYKRSGLNNSFNKSIQMCSPNRDNEQVKFRKTTTNTYPRPSYRETVMTQTPIQEKPIQFSRCYLAKPSETYPASSSNSFSKSLYQSKSSTKLQLIKNDSDMQKSGVKLQDSQNGRMGNKVSRYEDKKQNYVMKSYANIVISNKQNILQKKELEAKKDLDRSQHQRNSRSKSPISLIPTSSSIKPFVPIQFRKTTSNDAEDKSVQRQSSKSQLKRLSSITPKAQKSPISQTKIPQQTKPGKQKLKNLKLQDFCLGKKLGEGRFGMVWVAIHKLSGGIFALKKIGKSTIKGNFMIQQFILQVKIQSIIESPFIVKTYGIFDDKENIYLLLEYLEGGTLYNVLKMKGKGKLTEEEVSTKTRMICQAVSCLHQKGIAHRDIKPQNIIITNEICKLADFGWATCCDQRRKTYCGTTDYVAPQIIEGLQYDMSVDLWCIGVLAYELLSGRAPFYHISRQETFNKIKNVDSSSINYPDYFSCQAIDFISRLIKKSPNQRMIMPQALKHPFITKYHL